MWGKKKEKMGCAPEDVEKDGAGIISEKNNLSSPQKKEKVGCTPEDVEKDLEKKNSILSSNSIQNDTQDLQQTRIFNPYGVVRSCTASESLTVEQKKIITDMCINTNFFKDYQSVNPINSQIKNNNFKNSNLEKLDHFKTPDIQNNKLNTGSNIDWDAIFNSINNQNSEQKINSDINTSKQKSKETSCFGDPCDQTPNFSKSSSSPNIAKIVKPLENYEIQNKESSVFAISNENFIIFYRFLIDYIKEKIGVSNNDFDTYIEIIKEKNLKKDKIIEDVVSDNTIKFLLQKSNINNTPKNSLQAKRCAQVIALALIKCNNFNLLKKSLEILMGLSSRQIYTYINNFIPFLIELNSNINIDKWLPRKKSLPITYEDCVRVARESVKDIIFDMTFEEFNNAMENRGDICPTKTLLKWKCVKKNDMWWTSYDDIQQGTGCPFCSERKQITYEDCVRVARESVKDIIFDMTFEEFNNAMEKRGDKNPNKVLLNWKCLNKSHKWQANYNHISRGRGCPTCGDRKTVIGKLSHPILECLSTIIFKLKNCSIRHEAYVNSNSYEYVDLLIERNEDFIKNIENSQKVLNIPNSIKHILIDFTLTLYSNVIIDKCYRNYQNEQRFLIIVLYPKGYESLLQEVQNLIQNSNSISFKEHVKVINFSQYLEFLNLIIPINSWKVLSETEKLILQEFFYITDLISDALSSDEKFNELIDLNNNYEEQFYS